MWIVIGFLLLVVGIWLIFSHNPTTSSRWAFAVPGLLAAGIMMIISGLSYSASTTYWLNGSPVVTAIVAVAFALIIYALLRRITARFRMNQPAPPDEEKSF